MRETFGQQAEGDHQEINPGIPLRRVKQREDVAKLVSFLTFKDANYITGQTINVDSGLIMS